MIEQVVNAAIIYLVLGICAEILSFGVMFADIILWAVKTGNLGDLMLGKVKEAIANSIPERSTASRVFRAFVWPYSVVCDVVELHRELRRYGA